jgi:hypothetical protein
VRGRQDSRGAADADTGGELMADKLHQAADDRVAFRCPGCGRAHVIAVNGQRNGSGATWAWNGSLAVPTFEPSINVLDGDGKAFCHSFVRDGMIQFLADCQHALAGQTVPLPDWPADGHEWD